MAKWYGKIGYGITKEKEPGCWDSEVVEHDHYGDVNNFGKQAINYGEIVDNFVIKNSISVVADPFAIKNFSNMLYVEFMDAKWKITHVDFQRPRIILTLGGVYNGPQAESSEKT